MTMSSWIDAHIQMLLFYGGVPERIVMDNAKTATTRPDYHDPELNRTYREFGLYYQVALTPTRHYEPRDKGACENQVKITERQILNPLRHMRFFSVEEINDFILIQLDKLIHKRFTKLDSTRYELFNELEKPSLRPLPKSSLSMPTGRSARSLTIITSKQTINISTACPTSLPVNMSGCA